LVGRKSEAAVRYHYRHGRLLPCSKVDLLPENRLFGPGMKFVLKVRAAWPGRGREQRGLAGQGAEAAVAAEAAADQAIALP
jgi:hypothetical protein